MCNKNNKDSEFYGIKRWVACLLRSCVTQLFHFTPIKKKMWEGHLSFVVSLLYASFLSRVKYTRSDYASILHYLHTPSCLILNRVSCDDDGVVSNSCLLSTTTRSLWMPFWFRLCHNCLSTNLFGSITQLISNRLLASKIIWRNADLILGVVVSRISDYWNLPIDWLPFDITYRAYLMEEPFGLCSWSTENFSKKKVRLQYSNGQKGAMEFRPLFHISNFQRKRTSEKSPSITLGAWRGLPFTF